MISLPVAGIPCSVLRHRIAKRAEMPNELEEKVESLECRLDDLRSLLIYAPRAFVIEFAGTPKSGKSTTVEAVRHFFSRHGFRVHVLSERAEVCPIPMKGHLFFNTWCAASMLAQFLANVETETDIVIVDRGLFDALVWMSMQEDRGELTSDEARIVESFLLLDRWRSLFDLVVVMSVSVDEAISREKAQRISQKGGSIMNPEVLSAITKSIDDAIKKYGAAFPSILKHESTGQGVRESMVGLAGNVLDHFEQFLNPKILVVPRKYIESLPYSNGGSFGPEAIEAAVECIREHGQYVARDTAESSVELVQIISCGVLAYQDQIFLLQRKDTDPKYRLHGKATIWRGCHVVRRQGMRAPEVLEDALQERISQSLFLSRVFAMEGMGYCWDSAEELENRHFGFIYKIMIDNSSTAADLKKKEYRMRRGHGLTGQLLKREQLLRDPIVGMLENWSLSILRGTKDA